MCCFTLSLLKFHSIVPNLLDHLSFSFLWILSIIAAGVISCLEESNISIKVKALEKLHSIVDVHWAEVCDGLTIIEELSEDTSFPAADLAAAIASKCFFHLQSYNDSLKLALSSGK